MNDATTREAAAGYVPPPPAPVRTQGAPRLDEHVSEYMLHEFDHISDSLLRNEESGEKRVQFFIAVLTAVFGILGLAFKSDRVPFADAVREAWLAIVICLVVLFLFGLSTVLRLVERNLASDRYKFALRAIRRRFLTVDAAQAHPTAFFDPYTAMKRRSIWPVKGGWLDVVALLNSLILGALAWVLGRHFALDDTTNVAVAVAISAVALCWQLAAVQSQYRGEWGKLSKLDAKTDGIVEAPSN